MLAYDFNEKTDRSRTHSLKWELLPAGGNPMWVADMDFPTAPAVREAVERQAVHGVFGYSILPPEWAQSYILWWKNRYSFEMNKDWLIFATGVIPAVASAIRRFTSPADHIIIQTPVYNDFFTIIRENGRIVSENRLSYDNGVYSMDFGDLEEKMSDPACTMMILCSPHNPTGNIWTKDDLKKIGELAQKFGVLVVCDEIHCDLTDPGFTYIPYASVSDECRDNSIICLAPSKSFNIAGLKTACVCVPNRSLRQRMSRALSADEAQEPDAFSIDAAIAAYTRGGEWLDDLRDYLFSNKKTVNAFLSNNLPRIRLSASQATYLLWLDCSGFEETDSEKLWSHILTRTGLRLNPGYIYGECGRAFLRMNIGCPRQQLVDALKRLKDGLDQIDPK